MLSYQISLDLEVCRGHRGNRVYRKKTFDSQHFLRSTRLIFNLNHMLSSYQIAMDRYQAQRVAFNRDDLDQSWRGQAARCVVIFTVCIG